MFDEFKHITWRKVINDCYFKNDDLSLQVGNMIALEYKKWGILFALN